MPSSGDRLRSGEDARTATGSLSVLAGPGVTGSVLPPGVHQFTDAELVTDAGSLWLGPGATGAYVYRFPFAMSNNDTVTVTVPAPAEATRWGIAQHFWFLRGVPDGLVIDQDWPDLHGYDAHAVWDSRATPDTNSPDMIQSGHSGGFATLDTVFVVVEVNDEHPKPDAATIDLNELLAVLDTLIEAPTIYGNTLTATYTPAGGTAPQTFDGSLGALVPYDTGAVMTVQGNQFTNPITVTLDDGTACTNVRILEYEADNEPDGYNGFVDTPGRIEFFAPPHDPAANDDDYREATFTTVHGATGGLQLTYVDPEQYTQISAVSPATLVTDETATVTITGVNFEDNGFFIAFWTDEQANPNNAIVSFGTRFLSSLSSTQVVLDYPFTDGEGTTYTLDPGTYHVSVAGTYYRFSDATDITITVTS